MNFIQSVLGHSSVAVTERYFAKFSPQSAAKMVLATLESARKQQNFAQNWHRRDNLAVAEFGLVL